MRKIVDVKAVYINAESLIRFMKNNSNIILLFSMFLCGMILGASSIFLSDNYRALFNALFVVDAEILYRFFNAFLLSMLVLTCNFMLGLCLVGTPFICLMSVVEGIFFGSKYLMHLLLYGYENIVKYVISNVTFFILTYVIVLYSQLLSIKMCETMKSLYCRERRGGLSLRKYFIRYIVLMICSLVICLIAALFM